MRTIALTLLLVAGCLPEGVERRPSAADDDTGAEGVDTGATGTDTSSGGVDTGTPDAGGDTAPADTGGSGSGAGGTCPSEMVAVGVSACIDRYEAALQERSGGGAWVAASPYQAVDGREVRAIPAAGLVPQGYVSGDEAAAACANAGKRLCTSAEWLAACRGADEHVYPYGDAHQAGACNDVYEGGHPVVDYFGTAHGVWDSEHLNDPGINQQPGTVAAGGDHPDCVSDVGAFDLHGNLHEWVADAEGTFQGGFYADAALNGPGCLYATTAHARGYHDYSTGFRCCSDR